MSSTHRIDLDAYTERLGYGGALAADLFTFELLHLLHATRIPFENLEVQIGGTPALDLPALEAKLIRGHRGGYCFEQNALFAAVLEQLGFKVTRLLARVRLNIPADRVVPRTHMLLLVEIAGEPWLADVGFGGWGLLQPLPLFADRKVQQHAWGFQLRREGELWVLQAYRQRQWDDLYAFTLEPVQAVDYVPLNFYTAQLPDSRFVQTLIVQLPGAERRLVLRNREYTVIEPNRERTETIADDEELLELLKVRFGISLPAGTKFRALG